MIIILDKKDKSTVFIKAPNYNSLVSKAEKAFGIVAAGSTLDELTAKLRVFGGVLFFNDASSLRERCELALSTNDFSCWESKCCSEESTKLCVDRALLWLQQH
jgi:hypothetical protein